jgi:hypothetical protein
VGLTDAGPLRQSLLPHPEAHLRQQQTPLKLFKIDAQWGERTSVDIRNSAHAHC